MMSDQNPHPGDTRHSQIPVGCPTPPPPPPPGLTLVGALHDGQNRNRNRESTFATSRVSG